jgi:hypothetical protein
MRLDSLGAKKTISLSTRRVDVALSEVLTRKCGKYGGPIISAKGWE